MNAVRFRVLSLLVRRFERMLPHECRIRATQDCGVYTELIVSGPGCPDVPPGEHPPIARMEFEVQLCPDDVFDLEIVSWIHVDGERIGGTRRHGPFHTWAGLEQYLNRAGGI